MQGDQSQNFASESSGSLKTSEVEPAVTSEEVREARSLLGVNATGRHIMGAIKTARGEIFERQRAMNIAEFRKQNFIAHVMAANTSDQTAREKHQAALKAWDDRNSEISNLEWRVVEAAVAFKRSMDEHLSVTGENWNMAATLQPSLAFDDAVSALIAAREKAEKAYNAGADAAREHMKAHGFEDYSAKGIAAREAEPKGKPDETQVGA